MDKATTRSMYLCLGICWFAAIMAQSKEPLPGVIFAIDCIKELICLFI